MGSSPLARGGRHARLDELLRGGLIPARAGRTLQGRGSPRCNWAHPRSRGADPWSNVGDKRGVGSSPLARGGLMLGVLMTHAPGLIPARAGRTSSSIASSMSARAHPRSRGADPLHSAADETQPGSSPLARGGPPSSISDMLEDGLIPARAGRTSAASTREACGRAHPRSRGADSHGIALSAFRAGSSPLARGGPRPTPRRRRTGGLIPARAGRTARW